MAALITSQNQVKLSTSFAFSKLHPVDAWGAPLVLRAPHSSGAASVASTTSTNRVEKHNVDRAEPCFITNASSYVHKRAHWINAIRSNTEKSRTWKRLVKQVLVLQGIVGPAFTLDGPSNLTNLDSSLHSAMDKFAMFAVTCTHATLDAMTEIIQKENEISMNREAQGGSYIRDLEVWDISGTAEYEIVVLQPKHFLPNNSCLTRYPTQNGQVEAPKLYQVDPNGVLREAPLTANSPRYPSFPFQGKRDKPRDKLNPYLVILAAEIKFRRYLAAPNAPRLDAEYQSLIEKTLKVANLLYWEAVPGSIARFIFPDSDDGIHSDSDATAESQSTHDSEMDFQGEANDAGGSTARSLQGQGGTRRPDMDLRTLLSGRDLPLNSDDRSLLQEMALPNRHASVDIDQGPNLGSNVERVDAWRNTIAP